ncbi:hypothetical protein [Paenibacillus rhizophilus]|uniref:hypothetical protein n=1 Tax=Paenibacillus rhizophilus TaxID=1850366 RepID=UPI00163B5E24|nr:hypothetical protein [Paenibacillus rhizophilus]
MIQQLHGLFIHTDQRNFRVVRKGIGLQNILHPSHKNSLLDLAGMHHCFFKRGLSLVF